MSSIVRLPSLVFAFVVAAAPATAVTINFLNVAVTENFNSLAATETSSTLPVGWAIRETLAFANTSYTPGTGSSTTGDTYSFGADGNSERALGTLQSGSLVSTIGTVVTNLTGSAITSLTISYFGEQWRLGSVSAGRTDQLDFGYSTDATGLGTIGALWTEVNALDFVAPIIAGVGALDGNLAANRRAISFTITGLNIASGADFWLRWTDFNAAGADDGLAIDDFSITAAGSQGVPDQLPLTFAAVLVAALFLTARRHGNLRCR